MKQTIMLVVFSSFCLYCNGQTIEHATNAPRCGDIIRKKPLEFFSFSQEGKDVLWDFSCLSTKGKKEQTEFFLDTDSVLCSMDSEMICKYQLADDSLKMIGYENSLKKMNYTEPIIMITYPFSYGYSINNHYKGIGSYYQNLVMKNTGSQIVEADAEGSIVISEGDTLKNVVKLHSIRTSSVGMYAQTDTLFSDSTYMKLEIKETNQWYVRGYRYPLYETSSTAYYDNMTLASTIQSAYMYSPEDEDLEKDDANKKILEEVEKEKQAEIDIIHYSVSNDKSELSLKYSLDADASINALICDIRGMVYGRKSAYQSVGSDYQMSFDITSLPKGQYVLYINVNGKVYNEKFNIR